MTKSTSLRRKAKPVDESLVDDYVRRLEAALNLPEEFEAIAVGLEKDPRVRQVEAVRICKLFYGDASGKISRGEAVRRIRSRHNSLMDFVAKSQAQAGRSAA